MRISDWSSDVCSSDLDRGGRAVRSGARSVARLRWRAFVAARWPCGGGARARCRADARPDRAPRLRISDLARFLAVRGRRARRDRARRRLRSEEHTSELQSLMRISYAVFCLKKKNEQKDTNTHCL